MDSKMDYGLTELQMQLLSDLLDENRRLASQDLLMIWEQTSGITDTEPANGWLMHAYLTIRNDLFPHIPVPDDHDKYISEITDLLHFLRSAYDYERAHCAFDPRLDILLLSDAEILEGDFTPEYLDMKKLAREHFAYVLMRLGSEITPFNTLGHVGGVHFIAMYIARQLYEAGVPVDLGLISAAAASHDIGKYGCRRNEEKRVPYLHYYYTDYCLSGNGLNDIAHIAANHSVWDLEIENLSAESLLLIYADFRSKSTREDGKEIIHFYSLKESFDVILGKLDNVDEAKKLRYERVYAKLKDFENYMVDLGVNTEIEDMSDEYLERCPFPLKPVRNERALLTGAEIAEQIKYSAVDHNIRIMNRFGSRVRFVSILEDARSETDPGNIRTYIGIMKEYSTYMSDEQKELTLSFLYEMLAHRESDIREHAATAMGYIVAKYREEYKKELPEDIPAPDDNKSNLSMFSKYIERFIYPDEKYTEQHKRWVCSSTDFFVKSVTNNCRPSCRDKYFDIFGRFYVSDRIDESTVMVLMSTALMIDPELPDDNFRNVLRSFCDNKKGRLGIDEDLIILEVQANYGFITEDEYESEKRSILGVPATGIRDEHLSSMFLDDLKARVSWNIKTANISIMKKTALQTDDKGQLLHIATHFANLIKVSETVAVRKAAGSSLLEIIERLSADQRNELMVELFNGLEIADYQFAGFIPDYLGIVLLHLGPAELDEAIAGLGSMIDSCNERTAVAALDTLGITLENYGRYITEEERESRNKRQRHILGLLLKGVACYKKRISREAMHVLSRNVFSGSILTEDEKWDICRHCLKRFLMYLPQPETQDGLDFYNAAYVLRSAYRFLSGRNIRNAAYELTEQKPVAFFPGTFDPLSLGHKAIATTIRDMGFDVYLAIDEFSWSKKTLPHLMRKKIIEMSIASEESIYVFPDDIPVNIANPYDLGILRRLFNGRDMYIAVGSDVILNASAYKKEPEDNSIHGFNHVVFEREARKVDEEGISYPVSGKVIHLTLQKYYEDISSTRIRDNIDRGHDISSLVDPIAQNYIYDNALYSREPAYKHVLQARDMNILAYENNDVPDNAEVISSILTRTDVRKIVIESGEDDRRVLAYAAARQIKTHDLLQEFGDAEISSYIRHNAGGEIAVICALNVIDDNIISDIWQILLTEMMAKLLARDYSYAIYNPECPESGNDPAWKVLEEQGFIDISNDHAKPLFAVNMKDPIVIFKDAETVIKAPFNKNAVVQNALDSAHSRLLTTFRDIYPGKLLLSFNTSAVYSKIVDLVARANGVSVQPDPARKRGPYLSVPFGKALSDVTVPNTVTKTLRTDKCFRMDLRSFDILQARNYQPLDEQIRTLKSFDRQVILIDDLLHSGQRMNRIDELMKEHDVEVHKVVVGLMTGNALDSMRIRKRDVDSAYYIPSISMWLNERDCYPFIGGDSIDSGNSDRNASINLILPYTSFSFAGNSDPVKIYKYSITCLENAAEILRVLEQEYQKRFGKKLTLKRLGDVITYPRLPMLGAGLKYDRQVAPSVYIENEMRNARRLSLYRHINGENR